MSQTNPLTAEELQKLGFTEYKTPYLKNWGFKPEIAHYAYWEKDGFIINVYDGFLAFKGMTLDTVEQLVELMANNQPQQPQG